MITISHSHEDGTLLDGSTKGDGVYEIARRHGFAYFPSIRAIGIRNSRDRVAKRYTINGCAEALRAAGHEVTVDIDDEHRDRATVLADQAERLDDRADALTAKANRQAADVEALWKRSDAAVEGIPFGQPILVGHHSERGHRRALERAQNAAFAAVAKGKEAELTALRADAVGSSAAYSATPAVTARRIERAEAELRDLDRKLNGYQTRHLDGNGNPVYVFNHEAATGGWRESLTARRAQLVDQIAYDKAAIDNAIAEGRYTRWNAATIHAGDLVNCGFRWAEVVKVNKVTVSVKTDYSWTDKVRYTDLRGVRCTHNNGE